MTVDKPLTGEELNRAQAIAEKLNPYPLSHYSEASIKYHLKMWYGYEEQSTEGRVQVGKLVSEVNRLRMLELMKTNPGYKTMSILSRKAAPATSEE